MIGSVIRSYRERSGVSQRSLARRAGTTQAAVSKIESGLTDPGWDTTSALFLALGYKLEPSPKPLATRADPIHLADFKGRSHTDRMRLALSADRLVGELRKAGRQAVNER